MFVENLIVLKGQQVRPLAGTDENEVDDSGQPLKYYQAVCATCRIPCAVMEHPYEIFHFFHVLASQTQLTHK